jgi:tyrosinase
MKIQAIRSKEPLICRKPELAPAIAMFIGVAGVTLSGCATVLGAPAAASPVFLKELRMPSPADPQKSKPPVLEMVGATSAPFEIGAGVTEIAVALHPPSGPAQSHGDLKPKHVTLQIENMTGSDPAPGFSVYLNVPHGDEPEQHPDLSAGSFGLFGLVESSHPDSQHGGSGKGVKLNASEVVSHLIATKNWDPKSLRISFVPGYWDAPVPKVRVGRVSVYFM